MVVMVALVAVVLVVRVVSSWRAKYPYNQCHCNLCYLTTTDYPYNHALHHFLSYVSLMTALSALKGRYIGVRHRAYQVSINIKTCCSLELLVIMISS